MSTLTPSKESRPSTSSGAMNGRVPAPEPHSASALYLHAAVAVTYDGSDMTQRYTHTHQSCARGQRHTHTHQSYARGQTRRGSRNNAAPPSLPTHLQDKRGQHDAIVPKVLPPDAMVHDTRCSLYGADAIG
eukprot:m.13013 g.13013  ORF g.13013 m.13013 type:complete len:131 (-) comp10019_c0_seq1:794-1186(-)